jgi:hypothetical protein
MVGMKVDDEAFLFFREIAMFNVWPEIIDPPESAAFAIPVQPSLLRESTPIPLAVFLYVCFQFLILLWKPIPLVQFFHLVTWRLLHLWSM